MKDGRIFPGRVIFDHMPKTAGQAINAWLADVLGSACVTTNLIGDHRELIRRYGGLYSVISAHVYFDPGEGLDPRYQYLTVLREPLDRTVSWIFFLLHNVPETRETLPLIKGARQFLDSDGQDSTPEFLEYICNPYVEHFSSIDGHTLSEDEEKVNQALAAIERYDVVGLYEQMPRFLSEVASLLGVSVPEELGRVNVTRTRPAVDRISPALHERISQLNQLDLRFYAKVADWKSTTTPRLNSAGAPPLLPCCNAAKLSHSIV